MTPHTDPGDVVVFLASGVSFGNGEHPSTRLAIRRLDHLLRQCDETFREMLDIGSGSGVLALAALRLGVTRAVGLDTDPCALQEARANARLNDLACRLAVSGRPLEQLAGPYRLIVANLRPPTLRSLGPCIDRLAPPGAFLVMAGMRSEEAPGIRAAYADAGFGWRSQEEEEGWCALLLQKGG